MEKNQSYFSGERTVFSQKSLFSRVGQFFQVSPTVPLLCRVFHPDSKNGLFSALRRILNLHSVPDGKSVFLAFFGLMSLGSLF